MLLTIDSAGQVLALFTKEAPEHGVTEVAHTLGVSKSKSHELLASLTAVGLLRRTVHSRYRLGWAVMSLNRVIAETTDFQRIARPVLGTLSERSGELVHLAVLDRGEAVCVDRFRNPNAVQIDVSSLGNRMAAHCNGAGKVLLASLKPEAVESIADRQGLSRFTAATITQPAALRRELDLVRARGFATESGEAVAQVSCIAAPILAPGPSVVAAISLSTPTERFDARREVYIQAVIRAAAYVSRQLAREAETASLHSDLFPT